MFIVLIVALLIGIVATIAWFSSASEGMGYFAALCFVIAFFGFLGSFNWSLSSQNLTGYIYSYNDKAGYRTAHIRFSENAGTDSQPEFCVKADSNPGQQIKDFAGSGKKVLVNIPSYIYFANNPFACGTTNMTIKEVK